MLKGNICLLKSLPDIMGCTQADFCRRIGIDAKKFARWTFINNNGFNPKVVDFVRFCNEIHLAPSIFIQSDMDYMRVPDVKEIFPPGREWQDVHFDHATFIRYFGRRGPIGQPAKVMLAKLGKSDVTFREGWKKTDEACTLRLNDLFLFCAEFNVDINKFLLDPQGKIYNDVVSDNQDEVVKKLRQRERRIRELSMEVKRLEEDLSQERRARMIAENRTEKLMEELAANNWNFASMKAAEGELV